MKIQALTPQQQNSISMENKKVLGNFCGGLSFVVEELKTVKTVKFSKFFEKQSTF